MNCFIIVAMSTDGYIAKDPKSPSTVWTSKEDKKRFIDITRKAGTIVVGLNTWNTFGGRALKDRLNIIYSPEPIADLPENTETTMKSPVELLKSLEERGKKDVAICGGSQIYTMFMKAGVVNKLYITIEPVIFGSGIRLFAQEIDNCHLTLKSLEKTDTGTILLEYDIKVVDK